MIQDNYWSDDKSSRRIPVLKKWLENGGAQVLKVYISRNCDFPTIQELSQCDLYVLSGGLNPTMTNKFPWLMTAVEKFVQNIMLSDVNILGICYGHEVIGYLNGGSVDGRCKSMGI